MKKIFAYLAFMSILLCVGMVILLPFWNPLWFIASFAVVLFLPKINRVTQELFNIVFEDLDDITL